MELFKTLGLDVTVFIQFGLFVFVYIFLSNILFKPYIKAFNKRKDQTIGKTDTAERYIAEAEDLEKEYETKAREISLKFKVIHDESRSSALKEHDKLVTEARSQAKELTDQAKKEITTQTQQAKSELKAQIPIIAKSISEQMVGGSR